MHKIFGILLIVNLIGCSSSEILKKYDAENPVFSIQATSCYGKCPEFEIIIQGDGKVIYTGKKNVEKIGKYEFQIAEKEIDELLIAFKEADFWKMNDEYSAKVTDLPTIFISCSYNGKTKRIIDNFGAPNSLKLLEAKIIKYKDR